MDNATKAAKINKYMKQLKNEDMRYRALEKLGQIEMSVQLLADTKVGKAVNKWACDDSVGEMASDIIEKWKVLARRAGYEESSKRTRSESPDSPPPVKRSKLRESDSQKRDESPTKKTKKESKKVAIAPSNDFDAMLAQADKIQARPKANKFHLTAADLDTNYRPLSLSKPKERPTSSHEDNHIHEDILKYRMTDRQRVFAGRKKATGMTKVETLFTLCLRTVGNNINLIEDTGDIPFYILRPVLEKCTPEQLAYIESKNPILEEDGDCLWEQHFKMKFPSETTNEEESWKYAYFRTDRQKKGDEKNKLAKLREKIGGQVVVAGSGRQAIMADATAPRHIKRRQMNNGSAFSAKPIPSALEVRKARREIFDTGNTSNLRSMSSMVNNLGGSGGGGHRTKKEPPKKKAPLMVKTLKMLNWKRK
ncbi:unnamed protein product, partial [Mesorhabditis belari]|uniref:TFIIS N-terminal domain-containing protein n=1 Tax=Mesorhabditis belari TaxID=2138241 RepID=A0AAF3ENU3_9BILA